MDVKQSLLYKLLYHFQNDDEWMEFFNALLDSVDWSLFDLTHSGDDEIGSIKIYNRTPLLHEATETGFEVLADGGEAGSSFDESLQGGDATNPQEQLEVQDAWSSILVLEYPLLQGRRYTILEPTDGTARFYYNGVRSNTILYQGGTVYVERWDIEYIVLGLESSGGGFQLDYKHWNFPLLFSPGNYYNLCYAHSLYKTVWNGVYKTYFEKVINYTTHRLHNVVVLDAQTFYIPNLSYCNPEHNTFVDKLYMMSITEDGEYIVEDENQLIGEVYSFSHKLLTLKEPCSNYSLQQLQENSHKIGYRRYYQYTLYPTFGLGYTPWVIPQEIRSTASKSRKFIVNFTKESVPVRIDIPINFAN